MWRTPRIDERTTVIGKTGSGKTQGGAFLLSQMPFDQMPFVIFDFKREKLFREIPLIREIDFEPPQQPGLYIVRPRVDETEAVDDLLWKIWEQEYCGIFIDEGYMIGKSKAFEACLTQGRSKYIPIITLTQRPSWITRFAFSEADFFMIFRLTDRRDRMIVAEFVEQPTEKRLQKYNSYWYDVNQEELNVLRPVPDREIIKGIFNRKLAALEEKRLSKRNI